MLISNISLERSCTIIISRTDGIDVKEIKKSSRRFPERFWTIFSIIASLDSRNSGSSPCYHRDFLHCCTRFAWKKLEKSALACNAKAFGFPGGTPLKVDVNAIQEIFARSFGLRFESQEKLMPLVAYHVFRA
jgi:hypothetical protein